VKSTKAGAVKTFNPVTRRPLRHSSRAGELDRGHHPVLVQQHEQIVRLSPRGAEQGD